MGKGVYRQLIAAQIRSQTQYRASFAAELAGNIAIAVTDVAAILVMFRVTPAVGGFRSREVLLIASLSSVGFAIADLLVGNIERLQRYVREGLLDTVLIRPLRVLPQLAVGDLSWRRIGLLSQSLTLLIVFLAMNHIQWTPARAALAVLAPLCGALFFGAVYVTTASVAFWFIDSGEIANSFTYGGRHFTNYPMSIYQGWFRRLFAFGLGFGLIAYYPALALLGKTDPLGAPPWLSWLAPLVAVPALFVAAAIWRLGIRQYRSTGT